MLDHAQLANLPQTEVIRRYLAEPGVSDLVLNGPGAVHVLRGGRWFGLPSPFESHDELDALAVAFAAATGKRLDLAMPFANSVFDGRIRVHCVLRSAISKQTLISVRVLGDRSYGLSQLAQVGMFDDKTRSRLVELMRGRASLLVSGSSGSGKTTLLRALLAEVSDQRVVAVEDIDELRLESNNFVSLTSREPNVEGKGAIEMNALLIEALRMRPDRLVVGEIRSQELITLLQAANTGHPVAATIHANSAEQVLQRIETIGVVAGVPRAGTLAQLAIDAFVHIENQAGHRRVSIRERT